jgi:hypothetical protein
MCFYPSCVASFFGFFSAKDLIKGLLNTDPDKRFTINEVMRSKWISVCIAFIFTVLVLDSNL